MSALSVLNPAAFDAMAAGYDADFTRTRLGYMLRRRVWQHLAASFMPGQHVLELACGTGEDACWLAGRGVQVTATDGSAEMLGVAQAKLARLGRTAAVNFQQLSLQQIAGGHLAGQQFDGAFSNFGGFNTIDRWPQLAARLAELVKPGGRLVLVPMGPFCPWEVGWYSVRGQMAAALRRFRQPATARIGPAPIPIWYPSARQLRAALAPYFVQQRLESLGLFLPPSYAGHWVERWPALFERLNRLEKRTARLTGGWGDHYILVLRRKELSC